jgi:hypothetical protein
VLDTSLQVEAVPPFSPGTITCFILVEFDFWQKTRNACFVWKITREDILGDPGIEEKYTVKMHSGQT